MRAGAMLWFLCNSGGFIGCGHIKPPPPADCLAACAHLQKMRCATSAELCGRLCEATRTNQPDFPGCVAVSDSCQSADACR